MYYLPFSPDYIKLVYMSTTAQELLDAVNTAILDLITGKVSSTSVNGRSYTKLDLGELRQMRGELQKETRSSSSGAIRVADIS